jgi:hypothetical protein
MLRFALAVTRRGLACALLLGLLAPTRAMANPPAAPEGRQETALPLPLRVSKLLKTGFLMLLALNPLAAQGAAASPPAGNDPAPFIPRETFPALTDCPGPPDTWPWTGTGAPAYAGEPRTFKAWGKLCQGDRMISYEIHGHQDAEGDRGTLIVEGPGLPARFEGIIERLCLLETIPEGKYRDLFVAGRSSHGGTFSANLMVAKSPVGADRESWFGFASKDGLWGMASVSSSPCGADFAIQAVADAVTTGRNAGDLAAE